MRVLQGEGTCWHFLGRRLNRRHTTRVVVNFESCKRRCSAMAIPEESEIALKEPTRHLCSGRHWHHWRCTDINSKRPVAGPRPSRSRITGDQHDEGDAEDHAKSDLSEVRLAPAGQLRDNKRRTQRRISKISARREAIAEMNAACEGVEIANKPHLSMMWSEAVQVVEKIEEEARCTKGKREQQPHRQARLQTTNMVRHRWRWR